MPVIIDLYDLPDTEEAAMILQLRQQRPQEHYQQMIEQPQLRIINLMDLIADDPYADDWVQA